MATTTPTHCLDCSHPKSAHFTTLDNRKAGACQQTRAEGSWRCTCPMFEPDRRSGQTITVTVKPDVERFKETLERIGAEFNKWLREKKEQDERFGEFWDEFDGIKKGTECGRCNHLPNVHFLAPEEVGDRLNWCARCGSVEKVCEGYVDKSNLFPTPPPPRPPCGKCEHPYPAHLRIAPDYTYEEKGCHMIDIGLESQARECSCEEYKPKKVEFHVWERGF